MNPKMKKGIFWGGLIAAMILVINVCHSLFGGVSALAAGPHGHGPRGMGMGPRGEMGANMMMGGHHQGGGFAWIWLLLFLIIGITVVILVVKSLRKKGQAAAMQQFIDTSLISSQRPLSSQPAQVLDQWEKNILTKKENE